ncbi:speckle-type POZ [Fusarium sp. NRRL 25303]|nr:speckle-type POZ [Fusarium sp. NRRL 25303]
MQRTHSEPVRVNWKSNNTADYRLAPEPEKKPGQRDQGEKREEGYRQRQRQDTPRPSMLQKIADQTVYQIVSHLYINAIADYYGIENLAKLLTRKIEYILKKELDFHIILRTSPRYLPRTELPTSARSSRRLLEDGLLRVHAFSNETFLSTSQCIFGAELSSADDASAAR